MYLSIRIPAVFGSVFLAYLASLRVSEFTAISRVSNQYCLAASDLVMTTEGLNLFIKQSKTDQLKKGYSISVKINESNKAFFNHIRQYLEYRYQRQEHLFCHFDGSPLTSYQFNAVLKQALKFCDLSDI